MFYPKTLLMRMVAIFTIGTVIVGLASTYAIYFLGQAAKENAKREKISTSMAWAIEMTDNANHVWQLERLLRLLNRPGFQIRISNAPIYLTSVNKEEEALADEYKQAILSRLENDYELVVHFTTVSRDKFYPRKRLAIPPALKRPETIVMLSTVVKLSSGNWLLLEMPMPKDRYTFPWQTMMVLFAVLLTVIILSVYAVRISTKPLSVLAKAARNLGKNIYTEPLPEVGTLEAKESTHAFNIMQQQVQALIKEKSEFLAAISHDLKTPLTRLKLRTEMLSDDSVKEQFHHDLDDMTNMIQAALDYIRDVSKSEALVMMDMNALLKSLCDDYNIETTRVSLSEQADLCLKLRPMAIKRCLQNLIDNACFYGTKADIHLSEAEQHCLITIEDDGPGIPEEKLHSVFLPFYRCDGSRNLSHGHHGLGLSIAKNIIEIHGGTLHLDNVESGLKVTIKLPIRT